MVGITLLLFVTRPKCYRVFNVCVLGFLVATAKKDHQFTAILAEIDSVTRPVIDLELVNALPDRSGQSQVPAPDSRESRVNSLFSPLIAKSAEPFQVRNSSVARAVNL
jgi:hypothetical protein